MNPLVSVTKLDYQYLLERKVGTRHKIHEATRIFHETKRGTQGHTSAFQGSKTLLTAYTLYV